MSCVLIYAAAAATIVEVYVEQVDVIVAEHPEITEEWVEKVMAHESDGSGGVTKEKFIIAALEQFGIIDRKKHIKPLAKVRKDQLLCQSRIVTSICCLIVKSYRNHSISTISFSCTHFLCLSRSL